MDREICMMRANEASVPWEQEEGTRSTVDGEMDFPLYNRYPVLRHEGRHSGEVASLTLEETRGAPHEMSLSGV